ncbi:MAG: type VI secretion system baseplate subunit TssF, partial [Succinivibrio sp.]
MSRDFLDYYSDNLSFIRKLGAEYAKEYPKIAARLDISSLECQDPFIERLLEGTAFLSARVEKKLDDGNDRFLESVLLSLAPDVLSPIPSSLVLRNDDSKLSETSYILPRGSLFRKDVPVLGTTLKFESVFNTIISSQRISKVALTARDSRITSLDVDGATSTLELVLSGSKEGLTKENSYLDLFLNLNDQDASLLAELLFTRIEAVLFKNASGKYERTDCLSFEYSMIAERDEIRLFSEKNLGGLSLMTAFSAYPDLFKFIRLKGLDELISKIKGQDLELLFVFSKNTSSSLDSKIFSDSVLLNCIPLINLFSKRSDRVALSDSYEVNVSAQATSPLDYEISSISELQFFNSYNRPLFSAYPFFTTGGITENIKGEYRNFFAINRRLRQTGLNGNPRSGYNKSECFVSVSGVDYSEHMDEALEFTALCRCTNADLPLFINAKDTFSSDNIDALSKLKLVANPTRPKRSMITMHGSNEMKKISYILQNFASMLKGGNAVCLENIKQVITLFNTRKESEVENLVSSIRAVDIKPHVFRFISKGCVYFENGYNVVITFSKKELEGVGFFVFSKVIATVLQTYSPANIPLNIDLALDEQGVVYSCK